MKRRQCPSNGQLDREDMQCTKRKGHKGKCSTKLSMDNGKVTLNVEWWFTKARKSV